MLNMQRVFLQLAYQGTNYHGWQTQAEGIVTIQQTIENCLTKMLGQTTLLTGCGRTDTGVHARKYYAHLDAKKGLGFDPVARLNQMLPDDISIQRWIAMPANAHAQRDAIQRSYTYEIDLVKSPFRSKLSARYDNITLDVAAMQKVVEIYSKQSDFRAFCRSPEQYPSTQCRIEECVLEEIDNGRRLLFKITANRFLHNMVRLLVARMIDVGKGSLTLEDLNTAFQTGIAPKFETPAYAEGLYLTNVIYKSELQVLLDRHQEGR